MSWIFGSDECKACQALRERIDDLKRVIERLEVDRANERTEYKRAMDVLLYQKNLPIIGQATQSRDAALDPAKMLAYMEEEVAEKN